MRKREKLLAKVFYGSSDVIKCIVNNQESVMDIRCGTYIYWRVLVIVPFYVQAQVVINSLSVYCSEYATVALIQQCQDSLINIIVNKNNAFVGAFY